MAKTELTVDGSYTEWQDEDGYKCAIEVDEFLKKVRFHRWKGSDAETTTATFEGNAVKVDGGMGQATLPFLNRDRFVGR